MSGSSRCTKRPTGRSHYAQADRPASLPCTSPSTSSTIGAEIRVHPSCEPGLRAVTSSPIASPGKLALQGVPFFWHRAGRKPYVLVVNKTRKPPAKALFKDPEACEPVAKAPQCAPVIAIGAGARVVCVDLDAESPHIPVNASTGGGKSVLLAQHRLPDAPPRLAPGVTKSPAFSPGEESPTEVRHHSG